MARRGHDEMIEVTTKPFTLIAQYLPGLARLAERSSPYVVARASPKKGEAADFTHVLRSIWLDRKLCTGWFARG